MKQSGTTEDLQSIRNKEYEQELKEQARFGDPLKLIGSS
jgi:hypothetical protein